MRSLLRQLSLAAILGLTLANTACRPAEDACGDGSIGEQETCDDGNTDDGDGCSATCTSDESCGNGTLDTAAGEVCDDTNTADGDGCSATCTSDEICDDGNKNGGDGCAADCLSDETCGNSIVDSQAGEVCDDGNTNAKDGCSSDCLSDETCGNGISDPGEICDDGNTDAGDGCSGDCLSDETCGNDIVDVTEDCDDGNTSSDDTCSGNCICPLDVCDNSCVDTNNDSDNCGECGTTCGDSETCHMGDCVTCIPGVVEARLTFDESDEWRSDTCCRGADYLVAQNGDTLSAAFDDVVPPGAVVTGVTVEAGIEHACNSTSNAMEFKLNGITIGNWNSSNGLDCSCGNSAVGSARFDVDPAVYLPDEANIVSIDHNSSGSCHEAVTNVPGESEDTLFLVTVTYACE